MPLQIRRGTTAERLSITPLVSELVYDTTTKLVYVGDGVTAGGVAIDRDSSLGFPLGDLSDIDLNNLAEDDILRYDGTNWVNSELSLNSLDAVTITAPANNDIIKFNGTNWVNSELSLNSLDTVTITTPANNDIIKFNGTNWVNSELSFSTLPGINLNSPEVNQVLKFNGTSWSNENEDSSLLVTALEDLTNVVLTNLVTDQVLKYDGSDWVNSINDLDSLLDVEITNPVIDQLLVFNGNTWVNRVFPEAITADITGSVFADDSGILLDAIDKVLYGNVIGNVITSGGVTIVNATNRSATLNNLNIENFGSINSPSLIVNSPVISFVTETVSPTSPFVSFYTPNSAEIDGVSISLTRSRGSLISPEAVLTGDEFGSIVSSGFDGTQFILSADIISVVDGVVSTGVVPSRIDFRTTNSTGVIGTKLSIKSSTVEFSVPPTLPVIADDTARSTTIPSPIKGMIILMEAGTTPAATNTVQAYNGTNWVNLS
jgi:hypothetical protein